MSTAVATIPNELPAHLVGRSKGNNLAAMGGIRAGGFATISKKGGKFFLKNEGETVLITDPNNPELPKMQLELVVVGFNPGLNKLYFEGEWEEGSSAEPDCSSDDGITPDPHIIAPQGTSCATCPKNAWGSKVTPQGKQVKACSDNKRIVVLRSDDIQGIAMGLTITPGDLKSWGEYVRLLDSKGIDVTQISTKVQFDPQASHPKLLFKFDRFLTEEEFNYVETRSTTDEVRLIAMPRKSTPNVPSASPAVANQPAPVAVAKPAAAVVPPAGPVVPAPVPAPVQASPVAKPVAAPSWEDGLPEAIVGAVNAMGGPDSDAGLSIIRSIKPGYSPAVAPEPEVPADPFEGLPAHVKPAVDSVGGLGTPAGDQLFQVLTGKAVVAPVEAKKTRAPRKSTAAANAPVMSSVPAPAPAPVQQAALPLASGPTVAPGSLGSELENLLAQAMGSA